MQVTPYADVNRMLELIQSRIQEILGARLVGLYLSGSLVTGDFDGEVSDIDLVAVAPSDLTQNELDRLQAMHRAIAAQEPRWVNRIEVAYISLAALKTFRTHPSTIAITSPGEPFHILDAGKDWLINWYVVREKGIALFGPSAETFVDPISSQELVQWVREHVRGWRTSIETRMSRRNSQVYATLTMCRALYTVKMGGLVSKREAATWAAREHPEWAPLIGHALRSWREDWSNEQVDHRATLPETVRFVNFVVNQIAGKE